MKKTKPQTTVNESFENFLFTKIRNNSEYKEFAKDFELPNYIIDNLNKTKTLRPYQVDAIKYFIYLYENDDIASCKHLMFNMATGAGKTLVMACCILYLYSKGYRNFIFLVHQVQILKQAKLNFTDEKHAKYLFNKTIKFNGKKILVKAVETFQGANKNDINVMFLSTSLFYNRIKETAENRLCKEDFKTFDIVIIADEAHRLNVETKANKTAKLQDENLNWENAVNQALYSEKTLKSNQSKAVLPNMLLEFTATVELSNPHINQKYQDKLIYKYDFIAFNNDGYCKDIKFLYNLETEIEEQKKYLIVNAVVLSQYRKLLFKKITGTHINPVILFKSKKIADSQTDRKYFNQVINNLKVTDLDKIQQTAKDDNDIIHKMFGFFSNEKISLEKFISSIKQDFAEQHTLIYNSDKKERPEELANLDNSRNSIRAIFSVSALNEGWDVLSLYDIVHFDISEDKKVSLQDIQLIGRGARYYPFKLPEQYLSNNLGLFGSYENENDKRKFDNARSDLSRILETFYYHFVKTGLFLDKLKDELLKGGILNNEIVRKTISLKQNFKNSDTYNNGFVLINKAENRTKTTQEEIDNTFNKIIKVTNYQLYSDSLTDTQQTQIHKKYGSIKINEDFFTKPLIYKALVKAENGFFRFNNLALHIPEIKTIDDFIDKYLSKYSIEYEYEEGKEFANFSAKEKLTLLSNIILADVRKKIDLSLPKKVGSNIFTPLPLKSIFSETKEVYIPIKNQEMIDDLGQEYNFYEETSERSKPQTNNPNIELNLDISNLNWYAYDENYGTNEEKIFVKFINSKIETLKQKYMNAEIFLIRNELEYWIFNVKDGKRFAPDFLLIINDIEYKKLYYQCIFEVKGSHLIEKDKWKEFALLKINNSEIYFKDKTYTNIKNLGFYFYNTETQEQELKFKKQFNLLY